MVLTVALYAELEQTTPGNELLAARDLCTMVMVVYLRLEDEKGDEAASGKTTKIHETDLVLMGDLDEMKSGCKKYCLGPMVRRQTHHYFKVNDTASFMLLIQILVNAAF